MSPEEAAWQVAGAPWPLREVPKPTDLPDSVDTTSETIIDPARLALVAALAEHRKKLHDAFVEANRREKGTFAYWDDLEKAFGTFEQDVTDIIHDLIPAPSTTRMVYAVRWDDGELCLRRFETVSEATDLVTRMPRRHGVVVQRTITTTDWTEVAS